LLGGGDSCRGEKEVVEVRKVVVEGQKIVVGGEKDDDNEATGSQKDFVNFLNQISINLPLLNKTK